MEVTTLADGSVLVPCKACRGTGNATPESRAFAKVYTCDGCHGAGVHRLAACAPDTIECPYCQPPGSGATGSGRIRCSHCHGQGRLVRP